jgi:hypothetical protein
MMNRLFLLTLSLSLGSSALVSAQSTWAGPSAQACAQAVQTLTAGSLAQVDSQSNARDIIGGCGSAGVQAYVLGMSRRRTAPLSAALTRYFLAPFTDTAITRTALELAPDVGAGIPVRALSLRTLHSAFSGSYLSYEQITSMPEGDACIFTSSSEVVGAPLSPTEQDAVRAAVAPIERSTSEPAEVRSAASCVMNSWRRARGLPSQPIATVSPSTLQITYLCGNQFRIRSTAAHVFYVQWRLGQGSLQLLHVDRADPAIGYADTIIDAGAVGPVQLLLDGDVIGSASNNGVVCSA